MIKIPGGACPRTPPPQLACLSHAIHYNQRQHQKSLKRSTSFILRKTHPILEAGYGPVDSQSLVTIVNATLTTVVVYIYKHKQCSIDYCYKRLWVDLVAINTRKHKTSILNPNITHRVHFYNVYPLDSRPSYHWRVQLPLYPAPPRSMMCQEKATEFYGTIFNFSRWNLNSDALLFWEGTYNGGSLLSRQKRFAVEWKFWWKTKWQPQSVYLCMFGHQK